MRQVFLNFISFGALLRNFRKYEHELNICVLCDRLYTRMEEKWTKNQQRRRRKKRSKPNKRKRLKDIFLYFLAQNKAINAALKLFYLLSLCFVKVKSFSNPILEATRTTHTNTRAHTLNHTDSQAHRNQRFPPHTINTVVQFGNHNLLNSNANGLYVYIYLTLSLPCLSACWLVYCLVIAMLLLFCYTKYNT